MREHGGSTPRRRCDRMTSRASRSLTIEQVLTLLAETPARIAALAAGLTAAHLHTQPDAMYLRRLWWWDQPADAEEAAHPTRSCGATGR